MRNKRPIHPCGAETPPMDVQIQEQLIGRAAKAAAKAICDRLTAQPVSGNPERREKDVAPVRHLLACYDRIDDVLQIVESQCGASKQRRRRQRPLIRTLKHVEESLLKVMETLDIRPMELQDRVDFRLHEPVEVLHTHRVEDEGRIVDVVRRGFMNADGVVRAQQVVVLKFVPRHDQQ